MPTNQKNKGNNQQSNLLVRLFRGLLRLVRTLSRTMGKWFSYFSITRRFPFIVINVPTQQDFGTKVNQAGGVYLDGRMRLIKIVRTRLGRNWLWQPVVFIAFKVGEMETASKYSRIIPDSNIHLYTGLEPGTEILGDQVYFFIYSPFRSFESNYNRLVDFVQAAYIPLQKRRADNEYFRTFFQRENQNPEPDNGNNI